MNDTPAGIEDLLRHHAPQVLGALVRRYGHFDTAEDSVQEALLAASQQWPAEGLPDNPRGWLIRTASRRLTDQLRGDSARQRREARAAALTPRDAFTAPPPGESRAPSADDTLTLLFLCCHPVLSPAAQVALTLRAVGGLTTAEIARAHLVPEATMAQRISRAKQKVRGVPFRQPGPADRDQRLGAVLQVLYLIFNEGYTATSGSALHRADLAREAVRLTRAVRGLLPRDGRVTGLLALMVLTEARSGARTGPHGELIPLDEQDRTRWDRAAVDEGTALVEEALSQGPAGGVPAAGGDRRAARRGGPCRGHRLAPDPGPVRPPRAPDPGADGGAGQGGGPRHGAGPPRRAVRGRGPGGRAGGTPPAGRRAGPSAGEGGGPRGGTRRLSAGGGPHAQRTRGPLPADAGRPAAAAGRWEPRVGGPPPRW